MIMSTQQSICLSVIAYLCGTTLFAAGASGLNRDEFSDAYAQNEVDAPVTLMPREGVPDEDVYQYRATAPQEAVVEEGAEEVHGDGEEVPEM